MQGVLSPDIGHPLEVVLSKPEECAIDEAGTGGPDTAISCALTLTRSNALAFAHRSLYPRIRLEVDDRIEPQDLRADTAQERAVDLNSAL